MNEHLPKTSSDPSSHTLYLDGQKTLHLTGILDVYSFDDSCAILKTEAATLTIDGENLHVVRLDVDRGELDLDGIVYGIFYTAASGGKGMMASGKRSKRKIH